MSELGAWFESLWAPWRIEYLERESKSDFLREAAGAANDADHLVVCRRKTAFLMMNLYPYAPGHLMVVPYRMISRLTELTDDEKIELMDLASYAERLLEEVVKAQGFNVGWNVGAAAGAGTRAATPLALTRQRLARHQAEARRSGSHSELRPCEGCRSR